MLWEAGGGLLPPFNEVFGRIGISMLLFLFVTFVLSFFVIRPIMRVIELRRSRTAGDLERSEQLRRDAARLEAEYEAQMSATRAYAYREKEAERVKGQREADAIIAEARSAVKESYTRDQLELKNRYNIMKETLSSNVDRFAEEIAEQVLEEKG